MRDDSAASWDACWAAAKAKGAAGPFWQSGVSFGLWPRDRAATLRAALATAEVIVPDWADISQKYHSQKPPRPREVTLGLDCLAPPMDLLAAFLADAEPTISAALGHSWRALNVACKRLPPLRGVMAHWHLDRFHRSIVKLLLYADPPSMQSGTTMYRIGGDKNGPVEHVSGPAGSWLLLDVNRLFHAAQRPETGVRYTVEITLGPAIETDPRPARPRAFNATYPYSAEYFER